MSGHPASNVNAYRSDLRSLDPDSDRCSVEPRVGVDAEIREGTNKNFLQVTDVSTHVPPIRLEVEDRVAHELAGPVIGHLPAAVGVADHDSLLFQPLPVC